MTTFITPDEKHSMYRSKLVINFVLLGVIHWIFKYQSAEHAMLTCFICAAMNFIIVKYYERKLKDPNFKMIAFDTAHLELAVVQAMMSCYAWLTIAAILFVDNKFKIYHSLKEHFHF